jgi:hypothetical protein
MSSDSDSSSDSTSEYNYDSSSDYDSDSDSDSVSSYEYSPELIQSLRSQIEKIEESYTKLIEIWEKIVPSVQELALHNFINLKDLRDATKKN